MPQSNSLRAKNTGIGATNMWAGTHIRFPENDMKISDFLKSFFGENDIHTRADLNTWLKGPRSKLYDIVEKSCPQHWAVFLNERSARANVRACYEKILPGYKVFQPPIDHPNTPLQYTRAYPDDFKVGQTIRYRDNKTGYMFCRITGISGKSLKKEDGILKKKLFYPSGIPNKTNRDRLNISRIMHIVS
jgi:hypothetical protein